MIEPKTIIKAVSLITCAIMMSNSLFAAVVSDNDGYAFVSKAEFEALKKDFAGQIEKYNTSIDNNIDNTGIDNSGYIPPLPPAPDEPVPKKKTNRPKAKRKEVVTKEAMAIMVDGKNFPQAVHDAMMDWIGYKISRGEPYTEVGFRSLLTVVEKKTAEYGEGAVSEVIMESMGNGWKGIIWDRMKPGGGSGWMKNRISEVDAW